MRVNRTDSTAATQLKKRLSHGCLLEPLLPTRFNEIMSSWGGKSIRYQGPLANVIDVHKVIAVSVSSRKSLPPDAHVQTRSPPKRQESKNTCVP
jgi:hypothetical protein